MSATPLPLRLLSLVAGCTLFTADLAAQAIVAGATEIELPGGVMFDGFGRQVLVQGDQLLVTANSVDTIGAGYAYREIAGVWTQEQKFRGADTAPGDFFGFSADRDGDTLVVGAHQHDSPVAAAGAAYVFERQGGAWVETQKLSASDAAQFDFFGYSVAAGGDLIVVGASGDDDDGTASGSAHVFRRTGGAWSFEQKLTASTADAFDEFGWKVVTDGTTIAVSAISDEVGPVTSGAVFVFEHNGQTWQETQRIVPADGGDQDRFGWDLGLEGTTLVAGATNHDHPQVDGGAVYVYSRSGSTWSQVQELTPSKIEGFHAFGWSIGLDGDSLAVGAGSHAAVYYFHHNGTEWVEVLKCTDPILVGGSCSTDGKTLVGGNPWSQAFKGSVYVFDTSELGLDAVPDSVPVAGALDLETYGGLAGAPVGLYVLSVGGIPSLRRIETGVFDGNGKNVFSLTAPLPFSGLDATVVTAGLWASGAVGVSNVATITFQ